MAYSIRDLAGHFIQRKGQGKKCPHWWCLARDMTEEQLIRHLSETHDDKKAQDIIRELDRREARDKHQERKASEKANQREEHLLAIHAAYLAAEAETRGHMLSRAGQAARVDPQSLWTGSEARARKYASEELRAYWDRHGRLTASDWHKQQRSQREAAEYEDQRSEQRRHRRGEGYFQPIRKRH